MKKYKSVYKEAKSSEIFIINDIKVKYNKYDLDSDKLGSNKVEKIKFTDIYDDYEQKFSNLKALVSKVLKYYRLSKIDKNNIKVEDNKIIITFWDFDTGFAWNLNDAKLKKAVQDGNDLYKYFITLDVTKIVNIDNNDLNKI